MATTKKNFEQYRGQAPMAATKKNFQQYREGKGELLKMAEIMRRTGMPEGTIRSRYHRREMPFMWKLGRYLVAWERDLTQWLDEQQQATTKIKQEGPNDG